MSMDKSFLITTLIVSAMYHFLHMPDQICADDGWMYAFYNHAFKSFIV